jgi:hypothetical protein
LEAPKACSTWAEGGSTHSDVTTSSATHN